MAAQAPGFLWFLIQDTLFRFSPIPCYDFRRRLLRQFGCKLGKRSSSAAGLGSFT